MVPPKEFLLGAGGDFAERVSLVHNDGPGRSMSVFLVMFVGFHYFYERPPFPTAQGVDQLVNVWTTQLPKEVLDLLTGFLPHGHCVERESGHDRF